MPSVGDSIRSGIETLIKEGLALTYELKKKDDSLFRSGYQNWYTRALPIIKQLLPERMSEFTSLYNKEGNEYDIASYLLNDEPDDFEKDGVYMSYVQQYRILESVQSRLDDLLTNIQGLVQADIIDSELDAAAELLKAGHLRASGTLAGVVLEGHLAKVCSSRSLKSNKKNPTIGDWNDILKDANVYDLLTWRSVQYLADIRNLCVHAKDRDPKKEEVDELIRGVERITKTIF